MKEQLKELLKGNPHIITNEHYGNTHDKKLVKVYVKNFVLNHTKYNRLGYGLVVNKEKFDDFNTIFK